MMMNEAIAWRGWVLTIMIRGCSEDCCSDSLPVCALQGFKVDMSAS
jgi:hypothetical protein